MDKIKEWLVASYPRVQFIFDWYGRFLNAIGPLGRMTWFGSLAVIAFIAIFWGPLWHDKHTSPDAKLQALATIVGNALGIVGAVLAVMLGINNNNEREKQYVEEITRALRHVAKTNLNLIDKANQSYRDLQENERSAIEIRVVHQALEFVDWKPFKTHEQHLHKIANSLLVLTNRAIETERRISTFTLFFGKNSDFASDLDRLLKRYMRLTMGIAESVGVEIPEEIEDRYPSPLRLAAKADSDQ